jgi:hypothetical protein
LLSQLPCELLALHRGLAGELFCAQTNLTCLPRATLCKFLGAQA